MTPEMRLVARPVVLLGGHVGKGRYRSWDVHCRLLHFFDIGEAALLGVLLPLAVLPLRPPRSDRHSESLPQWGRWWTLAWAGVPDDP